MSAFLCSDDALSAITTYWHWRSTHGTYASGPDAELNRISYRFLDPDHRASYLSRIAELRAKLLTPEQIVFQLLLEENQASLAARYPGNEDYRSADGYAYKRSALVLRWLNSAQHWKLIGIVNGYEYQSCEHDDWRDSAGYLLCEAIKDWLLRDWMTDCGRRAPDLGYWASFHEAAVADAEQQAATALRDQ